MKLISWNINGLNSCLNKGLLDFIHKENADIYCFQEIKSSIEKVSKFTTKLDNYFCTYLPATKKGYSGLIICSKQKPISTIKGINNKEIDSEARVLTFEYDKFYLINAYFPHSNRELKRLKFKLKFNKLFLKFCKQLKKPIIIASDFNVAHKDIDLRNPKQNTKNAGFTIEERNWFDSFLNQGYIDTFREFNPESGNYTWWTYRNNARTRNIGWRIDYFIISKELKNKLIISTILKDIKGSDHCPIKLEINYKF